MTEKIRFRVRPGYHSKELLIEFCGDHRASDFPDLHRLLSSILKAESRRPSQAEIGLAQAGAIVDDFWFFKTYPGGSFEVNDDIWGLFIHARENNHKVISDIESALLESGKFVKEEVDFSKYA